MPWPRRWRDRASLPLRFGVGAESADLFVVEAAVPRDFSRERREDLVRPGVALVKQLREDLPILQRAGGRNERRVQLLNPAAAVRIPAFLLAEMRRREHHGRQRRG